MWFCDISCYSGIPCTGVRFDTYPASFPDVYHTFFDLNGVLDLMDPEWGYAQQIAKLGGLLMLKVAQAQILPWDVLRFGVKMKEWIDVDLIDYANSTDFNCSLDEYLDDLYNAVDEFREGTELFHDERKKYEDRYNNEEDNMDAEEVRKFNVILMELTRMLTLEFPDGLPGSKWFKQMIIDPGSKRYPYIWNIISDGCDDDELRYAFNLTSTMILDAAELLNSIVE